MPLSLQLLSFYASFIVTVVTVPHWTQREEVCQKRIKWVIKRQTLSQKQKKRGLKRRKRKMIKGFYQKEELTGEIRFKLSNIDLFGQFL